MEVDGNKTIIRKNTMVGQQSMVETNINLILLEHKETKSM